MALNFQPLSTTQTLGRVFHVYWSQKLVFWKIAAAVTLPSLILMASMGAVMAHMFSDIFAEIENEDPFSALMDIINELAKHLVAVFSLMLVYLLLSTILHVVGAGAMIRATAEVHVDSDGDVTDYFKKGFQSFGSLLCAGCFLTVGALLAYTLPFLLMNINSGLGMLLLVLAPLIVFYLAVRFMTVYPVIVVEKKSPLEGLRRSWTLSGGSFCFFFCATLVFGILQTVLGGILHAIMVGSNVSRALQPVGIILCTLSSGIPSFVFLPCFAILQTVLYLHCRIEQEGLTKQALVRELAGEEEDDRTIPLLLDDGNDNGEEQDQDV